MLWNITKKYRLERETLHCVTQVQRNYFLCRIKDKHPLCIYIPWKSVLTNLFPYCKWNTIPSPPSLEFYWHEMSGSLKLYKMKHMKSQKSWNNLSEFWWDASSGPVLMNNWSLVKVGLGIGHCCSDKEHLDPFRTFSPFKVYRICYGNSSCLLPHKMI